MVENCRITSVTAGVTYQIRVLDKLVTVLCAKSLGTGNEKRDLTKVRMDQALNILQNPDSWYIFQL